MTSRSMVLRSYLWLAVAIGTAYCTAFGNAAEEPVWYWNYRGTSFYGTYLSTDQDLVLIARQGGGQVRVRLSDLSQDDRNYIAALEQARRTPEPVPKFQVAAFVLTPDDDARETSVSVTGLQLCPEGTRVAIHAKQRSDFTQLWDLRTLQPVSGKLPPALFPVNETDLLTRLERGVLNVFTRDDGSKPKRSVRFETEEHAIVSGYPLARSPCGEILVLAVQVRAAGSKNNESGLLLVNAATLKPSDRLLVQGAGDALPKAAAFSRCGKLLAAAYDGTRATMVQVWNLVTGEQPLILASFANGKLLSFSADGKQILIGKQGKHAPSVEVWSVDEGQHVNSFAVHGDGSLPGVFLVPLGVLAVGAATDIEITNWRTQSRELTLSGHNAPVTAMTCSSDGSLLISGDAAGTVRVWSFATGVAEAEQKRAAQPPLAVAPFHAREACEHQQTWSKHLGQPMELTNSIGMKLVFIPAGEFLMGSPADDSKAHPEEMPQHTVRITKPFYLGVTEVTQEQYEQVMGTNPSSFKGKQLPVEQVSWGDAMEFCRKLSALSTERAAGRVYRLPTEAEWEFACRAGSTTKWSFGDVASQSKDYANTYDITENPLAVAQKRANAWGLYDMHGNISEWCSDWYDSRGYYANSPRDDPRGPASGQDRVHRGGSWSKWVSGCRSASRSRDHPSYRNETLGFRVAFSSVDQSGR